MTFQKLIWSSLNLNLKRKKILKSQPRSAWSILQDFHRHSLSCCKLYPTSSAESLLEVLILLITIKWVHFFKNFFFFSLKEHRVIDLRNSTSKWENRWQQSLNKPLEVAVYFTVLEKGCFYLSIIVSFHVFEGRNQFLVQKIFKWCDKSITVLEWKPLD